MRGPRPWAETPWRIRAPDPAQGRPGGRLVYPVLTRSGHFARARARARIAVMQVLVSTHAQAGRPTRRDVVTALGLGLMLVASSAVLVYLVFVGNFLDRFMPVGPAVDVRARRRRAGLDVRPHGAGRVRPRRPGPHRLRRSRSGGPAARGSRRPSASAARSATTTSSRPSVRVPDGTARAGAGPRAVRRGRHRGAPAGGRRRVARRPNAGRSASATATSGRSRTRWSGPPTTPSAFAAGSRPTTPTTSSRSTPRSSAATVESSARRAARSSRRTRSRSGCPPFRRSARSMPARRERIVREIRAAL